MNGGPLWAFAPLGAAIMLPVLIELAPHAGADAHSVRRRRRPRSRDPRLARRRPRPGLQRRPAAALHHRICLGRDAAVPARFAVNNDGAPVPFEAAWERAEMPYTTRRRWAAPAPADADRSRRRSRLIGRQPVAGRRRIRLRLATNGAESISLIAPPRPRCAPPAAAPSCAASAREEGGKYSLRCAGRACDGAMLDLVVGRPAPVEFTIVGTRSGLPPRPRLWSVRPAPGPPAIWPGRHDCPVERGDRRAGPRRTALANVLSRIRSSRTGRQLLRPSLARRASPTHLLLAERRDRRGDRLVCRAAFGQRVAR